MYCFYYEGQRYFSKSIMYRMTVKIEQIVFSETDSFLLKRCHSNPKYSDNKLCPCLSNFNDQSIRLEESGWLSS